MRFLPLALLFLSSLLTSTSACDTFRCCLNTTLEIHRPELLDYDKLKEKGRFYRVIGMTPDCHVFYGWMHEIMNPNKTHHVHSFNKSDKSCGNKYIALIKTEGLPREMIFLLDFIGNKIRLQNAMTGRSEVDDDKDLIWVKVPSNDRWEMMYTNPVDHGFQVEHFFNSNYRVFVVAKSHNVHRVYELKVFVDEDDTPRAYLSRNYNDINPLIVPPDQKVIGRVKYFREGNTITSGVVFVPQSQKNNDKVNDLIAMPMKSLLSNTLLHIQFHSGRQYVYEQKQGEFHVKHNKHCTELFPSYMIYYDKMPPKTIIPSRWSGYTFSTKRNLVGRNMHRRMGFPHVMKRQNPVDIRSGYLWSPFIFLGFMVGISLTVSCLQFATSLVQRKIRKKGSSSTSTTLTHKD